MDNSKTDDERHLAITKDVIKKYFILAFVFIVIFLVNFLAIYFHVLNNYLVIICCINIIFAVAAIFICKYLIIKIPHTFQKTRPGYERFLPFLKFMKIFLKIIFISMAILFILYILGILFAIGIYYEIIPAEAGIRFLEFMHWQY